MKCGNCHYDFLQPKPVICPRCGSKDIVSDEQLIERLLKSGRFEDAALEYEELQMWDKAGDCRRMGKTNYVISASVSIGKVGSISMQCPHCGASQPLASKSNEVVCSYCQKSYIIPKNVLDLL
jgi:hypothetical protein